MSKIFNIKILLFSLILIVLFLSIGYSAFNTSLVFEDMIAMVRAEADIRITGLSVESASNAVAQSEEYNVSSIKTTFTLSDSSSSITYRLKITNFEAPVMGIYEITGLPDYLDYEFTNYEEKTKICDDDNNCSLGIVKDDILLTIKYKDQTTAPSITNHDIELNFDFREFYTITYTDITNNGYPTEIIDGDTLEVDFGSEVSNLNVTYSNGTILVENTDYEFSDGKLTIYNVSDSVTIKAIQLVTSIELDKEEVTIYIGETFTPTISILPTDATNKTLKWSIEDTSIATISNGVITGISEGNTVVIIETTDGSNISKTINVEVKELVKTLSALATTDETLEVTSIDECATDGTCASGTAFAIRVNNSETYKFYVISDDGSKVTLIMDRNLFDDAVWISADDYATANTDETSCSNDACGDEGPITALNDLKENTSSWTNLPELTISTFEDDSGTVHELKTPYTMYARLPKYSEISVLTVNSRKAAPVACSSMLQSYLYENLSYPVTGYWTDAYVSSVNYVANAVYVQGCIVSVTETYFRVYSSNGNGIRPVIVLPKSNLIQFTITDSDGEEKTYYAEEGMTWAEWVSSDYNSIGLFVKDDSDFVYKSSNYPLYDSEWIEINKDSIIQSDVTYLFSDGPSEEIPLQ